MKQIFSPNQFKPTKWASAEDKAKLANQLANFVSSGFPRTKFSKKLYEHLHNMFGHIAHYDINGFYSTWFEKPEDQKQWIAHAVKHPCYGNPSFVWSDVELVFISWLLQLPPLLVKSELVQIMVAVPMQFQFDLAPQEVKVEEQNA